jgi:3-hydroxyisobutyrate dehydrogenase
LNYDDYVARGVTESWIINPEAESAEQYRRRGECLMTERVGFIGLGIMGRGMAANLLKAGFSLTVWNRTIARMESLVAQGAHAGASPADVAERSDITIVCVSDTPDVEAVVLGEQGVAHGARPGSLLIDCSTISPQATQEIATRLAQNGVFMLDAPVSGGSEGAAKGTLSIMAGGPAEQFERALPLFRAMGKTVTHVGGTGAGQTVKLVNQVLVVGNCLAMCEALMLAQAGGVDLQKTYDAISQGAAGSWMFSNRAPQIIRRDWRPGFSIDLQEKDLRLVLDAADQFGVPLPGTALIFQLYRTLQAQGLGAEGNHALVKALEHLAGFAIEAVAEE